MPAAVTPAPGPCLALSIARERLPAFASQALRERIRCDLLPALLGAHARSS